MSEPTVPPVATEQRAQEAAAEMARLVKEAMASLRAAEALADEIGVSFSFRPAYGMGGLLRPQGPDPGPDPGTGG